MRFDKIHEKRDGVYHFVVSIMPEDIAPEDMFDDAQLCADIRADKYLYFVCRVQCFVCGVCLGEDFLGGCCYSSIGEFLRTEYDGYLPDMYSRAKTDAQHTLTELQRAMQ